MRPPNSATSRGWSRKGRTSSTSSGSAIRRASPACTKASAGNGAERAMRPKRVLILVENLPSPFDRRVWQEATALRDAGYSVSIICPTGKGYECHFQEIEGIAIYRYDLPMEAEGALGYAIEYSSALFHTFALCWRVLFTRGFDVIHACNPPDLFFAIGAF